MKKFNTLCESLINEVSDLSDKDFDLALIRILSSKAPTHTITWTVPNDKQLTNEYKTEYVAKGHTPKITLEQFIKLCKETKLKEILKHKTPDSIDNQMSRLKSLRRTMQCYRSWNNETYPGRDKVRGDENFLYLIKTLKDGNTTFDAPLWNQGDSIAGYTRYQICSIIGQNLSVIDIDPTTLKESHVNDNDAGENFWGNVGAGILPVCPSTGKILIAYRSKHVNEPHTWGIFGGKLDDPDEAPIDAAKREMEEETGHTVKLSSIHPAYVFKSPGGGFTYHNFVGTVDEEFTPKLDWETESTKWVTLAELLKLPKKHFGLDALIKHSKNIIEKSLNEKV